MEVEGYAENLQLITQNWNFSIYTEYYTVFYTEWSPEYYTVFDTKYHIKCISTYELCMEAFEFIGKREF